MSQSVVSGPYVAPKAQALLLVLGAVMLWGFAPIGNRYFIGNGNLAMPGAAYMALRYGIATICFFPGLLAAIRRWSIQDWLRGAVCGLTGVAAYNLLGGIAGRTVSAGMTGLLNASESLMILVVACFMARRIPNGRTLMAAILGLAGIVLLASSAGPAEGNVSGILMLLGGALGWAIYCVLIPPLISKHGVLQSSAVTMTIGTLPLLLAGWPDLGIMIAKMTHQDWELLVMLAIGSSVVALLAWNQGVALLGAQTAGWFLYLLPLFSALGGRLLLNEPLTLAELAGGTMILGSVYFAHRH